MTGRFYDGKLQRALEVLQADLWHHHFPCFEEHDFSVCCSNSLKVGSPGLGFTSWLLFFFSSVYDFEAGVIFTGVRIAALCSFNVFMMCRGYFRDVINSSEREGFCDWMFRQVALFLQLVLVCQKMAHLIIFTDYITSKSTNISRTLKIKSKFLHINRKWQSNRQYTFHWYIQLSFTLSNFLKTTSLGP